MNNQSTPKLASEISFRGERIFWGLTILGVLGLLIGFFKDPIQVSFSYLVAFMFCLSIGLGALFLVMVHHLFDASWSVPLRRLWENMAYLLPILGILFIPLIFMGPQIYPWMNLAQPDSALAAKQAYLNRPFFYFRAAVYFGLWTWLAYSLRRASVLQDSSGGSQHTFTMRRLSAAGIFIYAVTVTLAAIDWMKSLHHQWFSTIYAVYFFAGCVWVSTATTYALAVIFHRLGPLREVVSQRQLHDLGVLLFAFTLFYAYIHFSQYLIIWNANIPEETFWYVLRQKGSWWDVCLILIFGHFLIPFLGLLRMDAKISIALMIPICIWAWLMHYLDMVFNIMPVLHLTGFKASPGDVACAAFMIGILGRVFLVSYMRNAPYPKNDPRLKESLTIHEVPPPAIAESVHENGGQQ